MVNSGENIATYMKDVIVDNSDIRENNSTMGRGASLTNEQIAVVQALHHENMPVRRIAESIKKSPTAVQNCIVKLHKPPSKKKLGRPSSITPQFRWAIMRSVVRSPLERVTASKLVLIYRPKVGVRRVQNLMNEADHLRWTRISSAPMLTSDHKQRRLDWAKLQLQKSPSKWLRTIFSDEKRFCLDGPDGASHHWADKRLDPRYFSTRQKRWRRSSGLGMFFGGWCTEFGHN